MSTLKVTDNFVTVWLTLSAEFTNEETEPLLSTKQVMLSRDHPLVTALVDIWHFDKQTGKVWVDDPTDDTAVRIVRTRLEDLLAWVAGGK